MRMRTRFEAVLQHAAVCAFFFLQFGQILKSTPVYNPGILATRPALACARSGRRPGLEKLRAQAVTPVCLLPVSSGLAPSPISGGSLDEKQTTRPPLDPSCCVVKGGAWCALCLDR